MMTDINKTEVEIECPACKKAQSVTLGQVINGEMTKCISCGKDIQLKDFNESTEKSAKRTQNAFAKLEKKWKSSKTNDAE